MTSLLWKELHTRALEYDSETKSDLPWLRLWIRKIPRFTKGCSCNEHWLKWYRTNPPSFESVDSYFEWTVKAHNSVNQKLNKPTITVEDAKKIYQEIK